MYFYTFIIMYDPHKHFLIKKKDLAMGAEFGGVELRQGRDLGWCGT